MGAKPENEFPTIKDLRKALSDLIERGLGDLAVQVVVAPDSTMQALARCLDPDYSGGPAIMIDLTQRGAAFGWWLWSPREIEATRDANGNWQLQSPRLLGDIRRRLDNAVSQRTWWPRDWETEFEALRRMDDGLPEGLDRSANASAIKSLGNTLLPQIPEIIGRAIMKLTG